LVGVIVLSGVALAKDIRGTFNPDDLQGTNRMDRIYGDAGSDRLGGLAGADYLDGGIDNDVLIPGRGPDTVVASDGADHIRASLDSNGRFATIDCGAGNDFVYKDSGYAGTLAGCENVKVDSALPSWPIKDADGDTWVDDGAFADNCPNVANASQADANGDGVGDACARTPTSGDADSDGIPDASDEPVNPYGLSPSNTAAQNSAALGNAFYGTHNIVLAPGNYLMDNSSRLVVSNFSGSLRMQEGAKFVFTNSAGYGITFAGGTGARLYNLTSSFQTMPTSRVPTHELFLFETTTDTLVKNADVDGSAAAGLLFYRATRPIVDNALVQHTMADGIHFANTVNPRVTNSTTDVTGDDGIAFVSYNKGAPQGYGGYANNVTVKKSAARGITVVGDRNVLIENFKVDETYNAGIYVAYETIPTYTPSDVTYRYGTILNAARYPVAGGDGYSHGLGIAHFSLGPNVLFHTITVTNSRVECIGGSSPGYLPMFTNITCN
jgi:hypothetical protein